jgi:plastocyanin
MESSMRRGAETPRVAAALATALALMLALGAVPSGAAPRREPGPSEPRTVALASVERVRIVDFAFRPRRLEVPKGTRVRWVNRGDVSHTTTSTTGVWDSGTLAPGETFSRVFRKRGKFPYLCTIHPDMTGRIVVT